MLPVQLSPRPLRRFAELLWPDGDPKTRLLLVLSLLLVAAGKAVIIVAPFVYKRIVDILSGEGALTVPVSLILAYGLARLVSQGIDHVRQLTFVPVAQRATRVLAIEVFRHLHSLSLGFHLNRKSGGIGQIVGRGTVSIEFLAELILFSLVPAVIELVAVVTILAGKYSFRYAAVTLVTVAAYLAAAAFGTRRQVEVRRETNRLDVEASVRALDSLLNYETVKYFAAEEIELSRYEQARRAYEQAAIRAKLVETLVEAAKAVILAAGATVVILMAARDVASRQIGLGDFVMINAFLLQLYVPLELWATVYGGVRHAYTDAEMMLDLLSIPQEVRDAPDARPLVVTKGRVVFANVSFGYDPRRPILHDVSFEIPPGSSIAIVGESGSGKSTIARLLFRFYDVNGGKIMIDGQDIRTVTQDSLRRAIGVVPQDTVLFNADAAYNIGYGAAGADSRGIEAAARAARIHDSVVQFPDGYATVVGERGLKLSGGEKQRIAIARVFLKNPPILILDEATSAVDSRTEREIESRLEQVATGRSTLVIAHRLSTIVRADEILVLAGGRIVERGAHEELLKLDGLYASMWHRQRRDARDPAAT
jgi:ATP-binding cassette subfamily B protein